MQIVPFKQVDVFTARTFGGNPVAVVLDAEGLSAAQMQHIAHWTNVSETAFVLPPTQASASYRVRIFTPGSELPFAGHPSVGTAHAVLEAGLVNAKQGALVQECAAGLLPIVAQGEGSAQRIAIRAPAAHPIPVPDAAAGLFDAAIAGLPRGALPPQFWRTGPNWWLVELADETAVRGHVPDLPAIAALCRASGATGLAVFAESTSADHRLVVRGYCPADGINEDPVTGSANAGIAALLLEAGRAGRGDTYFASQGRELGRDGRIEVALRDDGVWIGGQSVTVIDGMIRLDE